MILHYVFDLLLALEPLVMEALMNDGCPTSDAPFASFFPPFINKSKIPNDLPLSIDSKMAENFRKKGMMAIQVFKRVHKAINGVMSLKKDKWDNLCFDPDDMTHFLVVTSTPWLVSAKNRPRGH